MPSRNEGERLLEAVRGVLGRRDIAALVVADASDDPASARVAAELRERSRDPRLTVLERLERGRGRQMNAGAAVATAKWLLFLHVDTVLPADDIPHILAPAADDRHWGRFDVQIGAGGGIYRVIGWTMNLRSRLTGIATGDQAIFVRSDAFRSAGGFQPIPLMEDIELSRRLRRRCGRPLCLRSKVTTSARRWQACGVLRTIWLMWMLRLRFNLGASPDRLARRYREVSGR